MFKDGAKFMGKITLKSPSPPYFFVKQSVPPVTRSGYPINFVPSLIPRQKREALDHFEKKSLYNKALTFPAEKSKMETTKQK